MSNVFTRPVVRVSLVALVVVVFAAVGAVLLFGNQGPAPQRRDFQVRVVGSAMTPDSLQAYQGDTLSISIETDQAEEVHLHGYDKHFVAGPGQPATLTFRADLTGSFVLEIEATSTPLGTLQVQPRGTGPFGLFKPADQSSTTVVKNQFAGITKLADTASYHLSLEVGPLQPMYTPTQVTAQHPKAGEVMFGGEMTMPPGMAGMSDMAGMAAPPGWRHLEVHVFDKQTGDAVKGLQPVIAVTTVATGQTQDVPIVTMQGLTEGPKDFHYGNNILLPAGRYVVTTTIGDQVGSFDVSI
ncbi:MAG TPA: hypothetical protein VOB72_03185 [Candidatus Dormibacteraeota bacterium]|nr:hypothetical protein [Candidatus Dormibacteraeota bacterium]